MKNVVFTRRGVAPFENYSAGSTGSFDDAIAAMLIAERYAKPAKETSTATKLVRFVQPDRIMHHGCYARGEIAGFPGHIATCLSRKDSPSCTTPAPALASPLTSEQAGMSHGQEIGESNSAYIARGGKPEGAHDQEAVEALIASRAAPKGSKIRAALGV